ncbi:hypothetical protein [Haloprofundus halobius]|uniref:hypothetical protein n=1 Tax=Haloprofundus halobius TaxID=2876194 RepID=UPI001CCBF80A|nr:hypothetical protein [Haloprofundus halobius]
MSLYPDHVAERVIPPFESAIAVPLLGSVVALDELDPANFGVVFGAVILVFCLLMCGQTAVGYVRARRRQARLLDQLTR